MQRRAVVVAGPNGVGKTTFAHEYIDTHSLSYISADVIAEGMAPRSIDEVRLQAGRQFFKEVASQIEGGGSFVVESTLSGLTFKRVMSHLKGTEYHILIVFIFLRTPELCMARIQERVRKGGHAVEETDIRRRFSRSIRNFWHDYRHMAHRWHLFYNGGAQFHEVALGEGDSLEVRDEGFFDLFLGMAEEKSP